VKKLLIHLAASRSISDEGILKSAGELLAEIEEGNVLRGVRDHVFATNSQTVLCLWRLAAEECLPPGRDHQHSHRKRFLEAFLQELSRHEPDQLMTSFHTVDDLRLKVKDALQILARNDDVYFRLP
jgi:hypothetical protein